jgi:hypothetical protein
LRNVANYLVQVGNANGNTIAEWTDDITLAIASHIDGFALNIAAQDPSNAASLSNAFTAANQLAKAGTLGDFKMFFSFDYAAEGPWEPSAVTALIQEYGPNYAYFLYNNQSFVSTFEGPANANDWVGIKQATNCFFIPDWSSIGPVAAEKTGVVDGLFSWNAWPTGAMDITTATDEAYISALNGQPYMMPASPWFFTNLPGDGKNWLWRGDDLWYDRWQQVIEIAPEFVEIITWNDYGESHYIGPLRTDDFGLFTTGGAPFNYAAGMPHDGWRAFLPYVIDTYKTGNAPAITAEQVVSWYRLNPNAACNTGGTTGNTASQGQTEVPPSTLDLDAVYFSALLDSAANFDVTIGTTTQTGTWRNTPAGGSGIYHGSVPFNGDLGQVTVTIWRMINGQKTTIVEIAGASITTDCTGDIENWNAWVGVSNAAAGSGSQPSSSSTSTTPMTTAIQKTSPTTSSTTSSATTSPKTSPSSSTSSTTSPSTFLPSSSPSGSVLPTCTTFTTLTIRQKVIAPTCSHDNCLRAFIRQPAITTFCATYTTTTNTATTSLPWYVANCNALPSLISSACSCLVTPTPTCRL